jgi:hypothetical protein
MSVNPTFQTKTKNDKMYENLYHKVMSSTSQKHRLQSPTENDFNVYKAGWNEMQDKRDNSY